MIRITFITGKARQRPAAGDRRTTKKHGLQIRVQAIVKTRPGFPGGWLYNNGRPVFEWLKPDEILGGFWDYLLTAEERAAAEKVRDARNLRRVLERSLLFGDAQASPGTFSGVKA